MIKGQNNETFDSIFGLEMKLHQGSFKVVCIIFGPLAPMELHLHVATQVVDCYSVIAHFYFARPGFKQNSEHFSIARGRTWEVEMP